LPGGDAAVRWPWRSAVAQLDDADALASCEAFTAPRGEELDVVLAQLRASSTPRTSSIGRLFDAVAALLGLVDECTYEGHPAILLEQVAEAGATREYPFDVVAGNGGLLLDPRDTIRAIVRDLGRGRSLGEIAGRFHRTVAAATLEVCRAVRGMTGLDRVCLSGGVFQNALLTSDLVARLETVGFEVFVPRRAPAGDGGIALGQVLVANAELEG
jgi:hydrogenase maturation protein HypF